MRHYYIKLSESDFIKNGNTWTSSITYLYDNPTYKNYSTTKSTYGPDPIGNSTWVGLDYNAATGKSSQGKVVGGRYIDESGRVDIVDYSIDINASTGNPNDISHTITVYSATEMTAATPNQWLTHYGRGKVINLFGADPYVYFELHFDTPQDISNLSFDFFAHVRIDSPAMGPLYDRTKNILKRFPSWTDIHVDGDDRATPHMATPNSIGGTLINAMSGEWLERIDIDSDLFRLDSNIITASDSMIYYLYRIAILGVDKVWNVTCDGTTLACCADMEEFYALSSSDEGYLWSRDEGVIYVRKPYTAISINGSTTQIDDSVATPSSYETSYTPVWNWFDEFGLKVDIKRLPKEDNITFRKRILDVYANKGGVGYESFKLALRRELDLWQSYGATPDSNYSGATPEVYGLSELGDLVDGASPYTQYNDLPTGRFKALVEKVNRENPTTWGSFKWGEAAWDIGGKEGLGYAYLPHQYDASPADPSYLHSGIGSGKDLKLIKPDEYNTVEDVAIDVIVRGHHRTTQTEYPEVNLNVSIKGTADYTKYTNPSITEWLTVSVTNVTDTYYTSFQATAKSNIDTATYPNSSFSTYSIFNASGYSHMGLIWYDSSGVEHSGNEATPFQIPKSGVTTMGLYEGQFDPNTLTFINKPTTRDFRAWFSNESGANGFPSGTYGAFDGSTNALTVSGAGNFPVTVGTTTYASAWVVFDFASLTDLSTAPKILNAKAGGGNPNAGWDVRLTPSGYVRAVAGDGTSSSSISYTSEVLTPGKRYVAGVVIDGNAQTMKIYLNGNSTSVSIASLGTIDSGYADVHIGCGATSADVLQQFFKGNIYASGFNSTALTENDMRGIAAYYGASHGNSELAVDSFATAGVLKKQIDTAATDDKGNTVAVAGTLSVNSDSKVPDSTQMLEFGDTAIVSFGVIAATPVFPDVIFESLTASGTKGSKWSSQEYVYPIKVNDRTPSTVQYSKTIPIPDIFFSTQIDTQFDQVPNKAISVTIYGIKSIDATGASVTVNDANVFLDGSNAWTSSEQTIAYNSTSMQISSDYTITADVWNPFTYTLYNAIIGKVDKNGPYRNGIKPPPGSKGNIIDNLYLARSDFGIPETTDYIVRWIGVNNSNKNVNVWVDSNSVIPAVNENSVAPEYPSNSINEIYSSSVYTYSILSVKAKLKNSGTRQWNPAIESGGFYTKNQEYYLYADEGIVDATPSNSVLVLPGVSHRGAPIIVKTTDATPVDLRQVAFWDSDSNSETTSNVETVNGSGTKKLFVSYDNIYNIFVVNSTTGSTPGLTSTATTTNAVDTVLTTDRSQEYLVSYNVADSYVVDNDYIHSDGDYHTKIIFDKDAITAGYTNYRVWYEKSEYDSATPISLPLHPFYTMLDNGFVYVSYNEYDLSSSVEVRFSPSTITADGSDYILMSFRTYDINGNPKPNQVFNLSTDFGTIGNEATPTSSTSVSTNRDGFATVRVIADSVTTQSTGTVTINGAINTYAVFSISPVESSKPILVSEMSVDRLPADGNSMTYVYGSFLNSNRTPISGQTIYWRKARHMYDVFNLNRVVNSATPGMNLTAGSVTTDVDGRFSIGPFVSATPSDVGYWFVAVEGEYTQDATPKYEGDAVYWHEYPVINDGVGTYSGLVPSNSINHEWWEIPEYATPVMFPLYHDETAGQHATPNPVTMIWEPPEWYGIDRYQQYQLGLLGNNYNEYDYSIAKYRKHPDHKDM